MPANWSTKQIDILTRCSRLWRAFSFTKLYLGVSRQCSGNSFISMYSFIALCLSNWLQLLRLIAYQSLHLDNVHHTFLLNSNHKLYYDVVYPPVTVAMDPSRTYRYLHQSVHYHPIIIMFNYYVGVFAAGFNKKFTYLLKINDDIVTVARLSRWTVEWERTNDEEVDVDMWGMRLGECWKENNGVARWGQPRMGWEKQVQKKICFKTGYNLNMCVTSGNGSMEWRDFRHWLAE